MSELKPCPFCGSPAYSYHDNCIDFAGVKCDLGGCVCADILITENNWNTRPVEDALTARIAELVSSNMVMAKGVLDLKARIAELEADNAEFRQLIRDWSIVLEQDDEFQLWYVESVRQAMLEINKECEK